MFFILELRPNLKYWVGLENSGSGWQWIDSSTSTYRNWASSTAPTTGCVIANAANTATGTWSTLDCMQRYAGNQGIICKMSVAGTATTTSATACKSFFTFWQSSR